MNYHVATGGDYVCGAAVGNETHMSVLLQVKWKSERCGGTHFVCFYLHLSQTKSLSVDTRDPKLLYYGLPPASVMHYLHCG